MPGHFHRRVLSSQNEDYLMGNCVTCSSLMKWPKGLNEFRCIICDTINDLAPRKKRDGSGPQSAKERISLRHTEELVQDSLRTYLVKKLCRNTRQAESSSEYSHRYSFSEAPTLRPNPSAPSSGASLPVKGKPRAGSVGQQEDISSIFRPVHNYLVSCFKSFETISSSFPSRAPHSSTTPIPSSKQTNRSPGPGDNESSSTSNSPWDSPSIQWEELYNWYAVVTNPAENWPVVCAEISQRPDYRNPSDADLRKAEQYLLQAQARMRRALMKITENILKRPGGKITTTQELRFFLIVLENPLLHSDSQDWDEAHCTRATQAHGTRNGIPSTGPLSGRHSRIIKRIIGLISNLPPELHRQLTAWWSEYQADRFIKTKELISGFLTYRLLRQEAKSCEQDVDFVGSLVPPGRSSAAPQDGITSRRSQSSKDAPKQNFYADDWQIQAAARVLSLLFDANNPYSPNRMGNTTSWSGEAGGWRPSVVKGRFLPMSDFYSSVVDSIDLVEDFTGWERRAQRFSFCQYPFLMSIWAKTQILEYDTRRQMEGYAREAFFNEIMNGRQANRFLALSVRRDCLVEDSLKAVGESLGSATDDAKKPLRVQFKGEEGIDGGGLRKEWFLLLVREVFSPDMGLFTYDEDSKYCYFNPYSFENTDQFFLVGAVLGLAIYNSIILDVPLPPFMFRKLLSVAPNTTQQNQFTHVRQHMRYGLEDLAQYRPQLARGLKQLLEYDGDVEKTFCADFAIDVQKYDTTVRVPLRKGGETRPVTNANRQEYVDLYIHYLLDTAVARQFEPFKRGFYNVCSGNAFSLFRPEEVELLIRGSDEQLDVATLRGVAEYENWSSQRPDGVDSQVGWFWEVFGEASPSDQRKLLLFITGSDRLPAAGASLMPIRLACLGEDCQRFPVARTCFNLLSLWKYSSKEKLRSMLWRAVYESEGFGLK